jgi:hypothetical protein
MGVGLNKHLPVFARAPLHMAIIHTRSTGGKTSGEILQSKCLYKKKLKNNINNLSISNIIFLKRTVKIPEAN